MTATEGLQRGQEDQQVQVSAVTIGQLIPVAGVWCELTEVEEDAEGQYFVLRPRTLTSGFRKDILRRMAGAGKPRRRRGKGPHRPNKRRNRQ